LLLREHNTASPNVFKNSANNHYYERVMTPSGITWDAAKEAAEKRTYRGLRGHLVTITSVQEQAFLLASLASLKGYWYGGYQDVSAPDYHEPDGGWRWVTGEPFLYSYWSPNNPDDYRPWGGLNANQDAVVGGMPDGQWDDLQRSAIRADPDCIRGYIIEYESLPKSSPASVSKRRPGASQPSQGGVHPYVAANFVWIKPGTFMMGSPDSDTAAFHTEKPPHRVTLTHDFWMGRCEVTQGEFEKLMGYNPSNFRDMPLRPVEQISWVQAVSYCDRLTHSERAAGRLPKGYVYRLPTEAEWEYACRAGTETRYSFGDKDADLPKYAWYAANSGDTTHPVAQKLPNPWGLYDMHGNVWELCHDWFGPYDARSVTDPEGPTLGEARVHRGCSMHPYDMKCRSAERTSLQPILRGGVNTGFRVVLARPLRCDEASKGPAISPPPGLNVAPPCEAIARLPGKTLWLKAGLGMVAADTNALGAHLSRWMDQSGKARDAVSWGSSMPLLNWKGPGGQPSVQFDGIHDMMNVTGIDNLINDRSNFTVFIKCQMESGGFAKQQIMSNWAEPWTGFFFGRQGTRWRFTDNWPDSAGSHVTMDVPIVISFRSSATDAEIFEGGSLQTHKGGPLGKQEGAAKLNPSPPWVMGRQGTMPGDGVESFKGHIMEVVVFDRCLTDAERAQVEGCLGVTAPPASALTKAPGNK